MSVEVQILLVARNKIVSREKHRRSRFTRGAKVADNGLAVLFARVTSKITTP